MSFPELDRAIREAGLRPLSPESSDRFRAYLDLMVKWNARLNLTAIRDPKSILQRHFLESIQCAQALPDSVVGTSLLDFGSGAGLPGIPIAICRPEFQVSLAESQRKKVAFLREVVRSLDLPAKIIDARVESLDPADPATRFELVTLRAVDKMADACRTAWKYLAVNGWIVIFTTTSGQAEVKAAVGDAEWNAPISISGTTQSTILIGRKLKS